MCDQIQQQCHGDGWIALQDQPMLQSAGNTKPDSDVEARVNQFMQTTGRGLQGQYWRRSAFELSKWLTAQIQYERQGWQLKLRTALKEIENYRREALVADKILTDSLEALLNCLETCSINYTKGVFSVNKKKKLFIEYVDLLTEILQFLIQERLQCLCLMERKPDMTVNLVECIHQFLETELESAKEAKSLARKQERELHSIISELKRDKEIFQKTAICSSRIPTNINNNNNNIHKQTNSFAIRKHKKKWFDTINSPLVDDDTRTKKHYSSYKLQVAECNSMIKNMDLGHKKIRHLQEPLKALNNKQTDRNGKTYIVSNHINVSDTIIKCSKDTQGVTMTTVPTKENSTPFEPYACPMKTQCSLPPIKVRQQEIRTRKLST